MIQSIAGELGLNVYIVTLSRIGMDDSSLNELISNMPRRCIALMEDIDAAFKAGITRDLPPEPRPQKDGDANDEDDEEHLADPTWSFIRRDDRLMPRGTKPFHSVSRDLENMRYVRGQNC